MAASPVEPERRAPAFEDEDDFLVCCCWLDDFGDEFVEVEDLFDDAVG